MKEVIYLLIFLILYKLIANSTYFIKAIRFKRKYEKWLFTDDKIPMRTYKSTFKSILNKADVKDVKVPYTQAVGYGKIATGSASVIENFPNRLEIHAVATTRLIDDAIGVHRQRFLETFNPLFWVNLILFLPKSILSYLGLNPESIIIKIINLIWWILGPTFLLFRDNFISIIISLFSQF